MEEHPYEKSSILGPKLLGMYIVENDSNPAKLSDLLFLTGKVGKVHYDLTLHDKVTSNESNAEQKDQGGALEEKGLRQTQNDESRLKKSDFPNHDEFVGKIIEMYKTGAIRKFMYPGINRYLANNPDILCQRSVSRIEDVKFMTPSMTHMTELPYEKRVTFWYHACLLGGIIYIKRFSFNEETAEIIDDNKSFSVEEVSKDLNEISTREYRTERIISDYESYNGWGIVFQSYLFSDSPSKSPDPSVPHIKKPICTYEMKLFGHDVYYWHSLDGIMPPKDSDSLISEEIQKFIDEPGKIELVKVRTSVHDEDDRRFGYFKSRQLWSLCFLTRINRCFIGYRTWEGITHKVKEYSLQDLVDKRQNWDPDTAIDGIATTLTYVKNSYIAVVKTMQHIENDDIRNLPPIDLYFKTIPETGKVELFPMHEKSNQRIVLDRAFIAYSAITLAEKFNTSVKPAIMYAFNNESRGQIDKIISSVCKELTKRQ